MSRLSASRYDVLLECIRQLHAFVDLIGLRLWLLETALPKLVPSDWFSCCEVSLTHQTHIQVIVKPNSPALQRLFPRLRKLARQHPLIADQLRSEHVPVRKSSDILDHDEFHQLELYREVYQHLGVEYEIAVTIKPDADHFMAFVLSRRQHDYTESDRAILELLRPHLVVAFNHLALAAEQQSLLDKTRLVLSELSSATATVNSQCRIINHVGPALRWLGVGIGGFLPPAVMNWLWKKPFETFDRALYFNSTEGLLRIRALPTPDYDRILLVLTRDGNDPHALSANPLGLTRRENEIARWICCGKANAEIAIILGISPRTVHKHVEHILDHAGVESRLALTVRLLDQRQA